VQAPKSRLASSTGGGRHQAVPLSVPTSAYAERGAHCPTPGAHRYLGAANIACEGGLEAGRHIEGPGLKSGLPAGREAQVGGQRRLEQVCQGALRSCKAPGALPRQLWQQGFLGHLREFGAGRALLLTWESALIPQTVSDQPQKPRSPQVSCCQCCASEGARTPADQNRCLSVQLAHVHAICTHSVVVSARPNALLPPSRR